MWVVQITIWVVSFHLDTQPGNNIFCSMAMQSKILDFTPFG
jgi:hypothetical protein